MLLAGPVVLAFNSGGTSVSTQAVGAAIAFGLLGVLALLAPWPLAERPWPLAAAVALAAFAGWTVLSVSWSPALGDAVNDADRLVFYAAAFAVAVVAFRDPDLRQFVPDALLWSIAVVALYALAGRAGILTLDSESLAGDRLHQPLEYWNAMAILCGMGALLAGAVATNELRPLGYRVAAATAGVPCAVACYFTYSRAALGAVFAGFVVLALVRARVGPPGVRGWLAAGVVAGVLAGGFGISFTAERTEEISKSSERVTTFKTYRGDYWRVGLESFADHPLAGVGTSGFPIEWTRERDTRVFAFDAHSLYIETLAELGIVGFALLAAFFAAVAAGLRRAYRAAPDGSLVAAAAAVLGAFAVHAGMDWDWEVPAVVLPALLLAAAVVQRPEPGVS